MYNVLLVDDERYVRAWLKNCVEWTSYGFCIAEEAGCAKDALQKAAQLHPDLIISDMDMPEMQGPEFIEKVIQAGSNALFVVLSGHSDFAYMRSAVKNNAVDYLLKPVSTEDLGDVLKNVKALLDQRGKERDEEHNAQLALRENWNTRREKFFQLLLEEKSLPPNQLDAKAAELGLRWNAPLFRVLLICFDKDALELEPGYNMGLDLLKFSIINIAGEIFERHGITAYFLNKAFQVAAFLNYDAFTEDTNKQLITINQELLDTVNKYLKVSVVIGVGGLVKESASLYLSYMQAEKSLDLRLIYGNNKVLTLPDNALFKYEKGILDIAAESAFKNAIARYDYDACSNCIEAIFERLTGAKDMQIDTIKMIYYRLVSIILREIYDSGIPLSLLGLEESNMFLVIRNLKSISEIKETLFGYLKKVMEGVSYTQKIKNSAIERCIQYINEHYTEEITLLDIANYVYLTPNYLSTLFRVEMACSVLEYITNLRIEKVKQLMRNPVLRTYDIGEMVGYQDSKYFCRVFKKMEGMSPSQYRKLLNDNA